LSVFGWILVIVSKLWASSEAEDLDQGYLRVESVKGSLVQGAFLAEKPIHLRLPRRSSARCPSWRAFWFPRTCARGAAITGADENRTQPVVFPTANQQTSLS
jgi:hypothetical protein